MSEIRDASRDQELLPCPFCGSAAKLETFYGNYTRPMEYTGHCEECDVSLDGDPDPDKAIAQWNRREPPREAAKPNSNKGLEPR